MSGPDGHMLAFEQLLRVVTDAPSPIMLLAEDGEVVLVNKEWEVTTGYAAADIPTISDWTEKAHGIRAENPREVVAAVYSPGQRDDEGEHSILTATGEELIWEVSSAPLGAMSDGRKLEIISAHDVTERRAVEAEVRERDKRLQAVVDNAPFGVHMYELTDDDRLVLVGYNRQADTMLGIDHSALVGLTLEEAFPGNVGTEAPERYREAARDGTAWETEQHIYDADGISGVFQVMAFPFGQGHAAVFFRDITEKTRLERALEESKVRYKRTFDSTQEGIEYCRLLLDDYGQPADWIYAEVNEGYARLSGNNEVLGKRALEVTPTLKEDEPELFAACCKVGATGEPEELDVQRDGRWLHVSISSPEKEHFVVVSRDIDDRKQAEEALERSVRALKALSGVNGALVRAQTEEELLDSVCSAIVNDAGYALAWVGFAMDDDEKSVVPVQYCGEAADYVGRMSFSWGEGPLGAGPTGRAIRELRPVAMHNMDTDPDFMPWKDAALASGFRSSASLPIVGADGTAKGALCIYSREPDSFDKEELALLAEMAGDLAYGIETLKARDHRVEMERVLQRTNERLEGLLKNIIETMGKVIETRDPYTQGHETGVATLSKLIADEMGLSKDEVEAIEIAALLHDIGKLSVPAEILTKPGKLSNPEFAIIREHPRTGYEILKNIDFGWPIADIVLQHHERLDGSGYPIGLVGDQISIAARVVAVADVIEAMASHRPYRAALGLTTAMDEIKKHSAKFDPEVVSACVRLCEAGEIKL